MIVNPHHKHFQAGTRAILGASVNFERGLAEQQHLAVGFLFCDLVGQTSHTNRTLQACEARRRACFPRRHWLIESSRPLLSMQPRFVYVPSPPSSCRPRLLAGFACARTRRRVIVRSTDRPSRYTQTSGLRKVSLPELFAIKKARITNVYIGHTPA